MVTEELRPSLGGTDEEFEELLRYNASQYDHQRVEALGLPLKDEPFVDAWAQYILESTEKGVFPALGGKLVQLRFPICQGISQRADYRSVTLSGASPDECDGATGLALAAPERLRLWLHSTAAGRIPVMLTGCRSDFEALVQALAYKNEPREVPPSMGALIVGGYNNWGRIRAYRRRWEEDHPEATEEQWKREFKALIAQKERYQDRFILLSDGPYSGVRAEEMGMDEAKWRELSVKIRLDHECSHYFTRRLFSSMRNHVMDELIADYMGITAAIGRFRSDWFLRFMGLGSFPLYAEDGRLKNYRGDPPLSDGAFRLLQSVMKRASDNLEHFDRQYNDGSKGFREKTQVILTMMTLLEVAADQGGQRLAEKLVLADRFFIRTSVNV